MSFPNHPLLNIGLAQQIVVEPTFDITQSTLEPNWQALLLDMFRTTCDRDPLTVSENAAYLTRHIGIDSTFTYKNELIHNLKVIYARLTNQLSRYFPLITEVERAKIITPIADEITGCTPGLYNLAIGAVRNFTLPQTIAALLMRV